MKNLLITNLKKNKIEIDEKKIKNYEMLVITKNLKNILKKKTKQFSKVILITEKILPRNSEIYKTIKYFVKNENSYFIEIAYTKSKVSIDKTFSNALINGSGNQTKLVLKKLINI